MVFVKSMKKRTAYYGSLLLTSVLLASCTLKTDAPPSDNFNRDEAAKARINLALAYLEQNDFPKAKENIDKALDYAKTDYLPYSVLAYYYQQTGDVELATQTYQQAIKLSERHSKDNQPSPDLLNNYGTFLCKQSNFSKAYQQFDFALQSNEPYYHQADTLENIILCAQAEGNIAKQSQALGKLSKLDSKRYERLIQRKNLL